MYTYICEIFVCFGTNLFVRALLAKNLKLRRHRKAVRILWLRFELDPSTVARVASSQSFFSLAVDKAVPNEEKKRHYWSHLSMTKYHVS